MIKKIQDTRCKIQINGNIQNSNLKRINWNLFLVIFLFLVSCSLFLDQCHAWRITKELEHEIKIKKAAIKNNDPDTYFDLAITFAYTNRIEEGWSLLKKADQMDKTFKNRAYKEYAAKVTASPSDWKLRFRYAFALYFAGKKNEAIKELKNVLILDPYNVWAYGYISLIYGEMNQIDKAIEAAKAGIKIDSFVAALHLLLSSGYYRKGDSWGGLGEAATAVRLRAQGY